MKKKYTNMNRKNIKNIKYKIYKKNYIKTTKNIESKIEKMKKI